MEVIDLVRIESRNYKTNAQMHLIQANQEEILHMGCQGELLPNQVAKFDFDTIIANTTDHRIWIALIPADPVERDPNCSIVLMYGDSFGATGFDTNPGHRYVFVNRGGKDVCVGPRPAWEGSNPDPRKRHLDPEEEEKYKFILEILYQDLGNPTTAW